MRTLVFVLTLALVAGCETFTGPAKSINLTGKSDALHLNSNRRMAYLLEMPDPNNKGQMRMFLVSEPPPDTALASTVNALAKISADVAKESGSAEGKLDVTQTITQITRAISISILRDTLFRLSEAYANGAIDSKQYEALHSQVAKAVTELAAKEVERAREQAKVEEQKAKQLESQVQLQGQRAELLRQMQTEADPAKREQLLQGFRTMQMGGDGVGPR